MPGDFENGGYFDGACFTQGVCEHYEKESKKSSILPVNYWRSTTCGIFDNDIDEPKPDTI